MAKFHLSRKFVCAVVVVGVVFFTNFPPTLSLALPDTESQQLEDEYFCIREESGAYLAPERSYPSEFFTGGIILEDIDHINFWQNDKYLFKFQSSSTGLKVINKLSNTFLSYLESTGVYDKRFVLRDFNYNPAYNISVIVSPIAADPSLNFIHNVHGDMIRAATSFTTTYTFLLSTKNQETAGRWKLIYPKPIDPTPPPSCDLTTTQYFCIFEESNGLFLRHTNTTSAIEQGGGLDLAASNTTLCTQNDLFLFHFVRQGQGQNVHIYNKVAENKLSYLEPNGQDPKFYFSDFRGNYNTSVRFVQSSSDPNVYYLYANYGRMVANKAGGGQFSRMFSTPLLDYFGQYQAGRWKLHCSGTSPPIPPQPDCNLSTKKSFCVRDSATGQFLRHDNQVGEDGIRGLELVQGGADTCSLQNTNYLFKMENTFVQHVGTGLKITHKKYYSLPDNAYKFFFVLHVNPKDGDSFANIRSVSVNDPYRFLMSPASSARIHMTNSVVLTGGLGGLSDTTDASLRGYFELVCVDDEIASTTEGAMTTTARTEDSTNKEDVEPTTDVIRTNSPNTAPSVEDTTPSSSAKLEIPLIVIFVLTFGCVIL